MKPLLITDASVLLNLLASEAFEEIAHQCGWRFVICEVVQSEVLALRNAETGEMEPVDLQRLINANLIEVVSLDVATESSCYIEYAALVDDEEAMSLAIAEMRNLAIALDDRRAINVAHGRGIKVPMLTTPEMLHTWHQEHGKDEAKMAAALKNIETRARYIPPKNHPLRQWWQECRAIAGD